MNNVLREFLKSLSDEQIGVLASGLIFENQNIDTLIRAVGDEMDNRESHQEIEHWQDDKDLDDKFWQALHDICEEKGIHPYAASQVLDVGFNFNYTDYDGTLDEAIEVIRTTADQLIANEAIRMNDRPKRTRILR